MYSIVMRLVEIGYTLKQGVSNAYAKTKLALTRAKRLLSHMATYGHNLKLVKVCAKCLCPTCKGKRQP